MNNICELYFLPIYRNGSTSNFCKCPGDLPVTLATPSTQSHALLPCLPVLITCGLPSGSGEIARGVKIRLAPLVKVSQ